MPQKRKKVLFVDDDLSFLDVLKALMASYAADTWDIFTASETGEALAILQENHPDLVVVDVHMPVVDGLQFLRLLQRKYPNTLKVVLTGDATEHYRAACLSSGAELFLEKPATAAGWHSVYKALNELAGYQAEEGFRGVLRRVGLEDVLQMECLARHSLTLEVSTHTAQGTIIVRDGEIIHAEAGERPGETAFYYLMSLKGGHFNLKPFVEPATRTITGSWEFLLMEAARKRDEDRDNARQPEGETTSLKPTAPEESLRQQRDETGEMTAAVDSVSKRPGAMEATDAQPGGQAGPLAEAEAIVSEPGPAAVVEEALKPQIDEVLICSAQGDVLYEWQCRDANARVGFLEFLSQKARHLAQGLPLGDFERLEVHDAKSRVIARIQTDRAMLVRSSKSAG